MLRRQLPRLRGALAGPGLRSSALPVAPAYSPPSACLHCQIAQNSKYSSVDRPRRQAAVLNLRSRHFHSAGLVVRRSDASDDNKPREGDALSASPDDEEDLNDSVLEKFPESLSGWAPPKQEDQSMMARRSLLYESRRIDGADPEYEGYWPEKWEEDIDEALYKAADADPMADFQAIDDGIAEEVEALLPLELDKLPQGTDGDGGVDRYELLKLVDEIDADDDHIDMSSLSESDRAKLDSLFHDTQPNVDGLPEPPPMPAADEDPIEQDFDDFWLEPDPDREQLGAVRSEFEWLDFNEDIDWQREAPKTRQGKVSVFNTRRGYGFIEPVYPRGYIGFRERFFVHWSELRPSDADAEWAKDSRGHPTLKPGQRVEFSVEHKVLSADPAALSVKLMPAEAPQLMAEAGAPGGIAGVLEADLDS